MPNEIIVPDIGDFESVEIIEILVKAGDIIEKNSPIVTLESDKSSVEVPSPFGGKISIYYTFSRFKKYIGNDLILKNNKKIFSCNHEDHLNDSNDLSFGDAEVTILHEILHTMSMPPRCGKNVDKINKHVKDNKQDILNKVSGNLYLDYNNDDYYNHKIDNCLDLKNSSYLTK